MAILQVPVSAPGATQAAGEVRQFAGALQATAQSAQQVGQQTGTAAAGVKAVGQQAAVSSKELRDMVRELRIAKRESDALAESAKKTGGGHGGGHGGGKVNLGNFAPMGSENLMSRVGHAAGIDTSKLGAAAGPLALGAVALYTSLEALNTMTEHETAIKVEGVRAADNFNRALSESTKKIAEQGLAAGRADQMDLRRLMAQGGDVAVAAGRQAVLDTGDAGALGATADIYQNIKDPAQRAMALDAMRKGSRLGIPVGSMKLDRFTVAASADSSSLVGKFDHDTEGRARSGADVDARLARVNGPLIDLLTDDQRKQMQIRQEQTGDIGGISRAAARGRRELRAPGLGAAAADVRSASLAVDVAREEFEDTMGVGYGGIVIGLGAGAKGVELEKANKRLQGALDAYTALMSRASRTTGSGNRSQP